MRLIALAPVLVLIACTASPDATLETTYDVCAPVTLSAATSNPTQLAGIARALQLWSARGASTLEMASPSEIELRFETAADAFHGRYDGERVVYVNERIADPSTLGIVIAHELGHAFGLQHVDPGERPSLMNPGNLTTPPNEADRRALEAIWGPCN